MNVRVIQNRLVRLLGGLLFLVAALAGCGPGPEEVQATVSRGVAAAVEATVAARPTSTAYATATGLATATAYPVMPGPATATPYPTEPPYPTATAYPTHTPLPTPTATEPPPTAPAPAGNVYQPPATGSGDIEVEILRLVTAAERNQTLLFGVIRQQPDCQALVDAYDGLTSNPGLDVSGASPTFRGAYQVYLDSVEYYNGPNAVSDMADQCRAFLAEGRAQGQFSVHFFRAAREYTLFGPDLEQALKNIGGE